MKPINYKQRNKAFISYLLLFTLCNALIVSLVYFNYQVPVEENDYLEHKIKYVNLKMNEVEGFGNHMRKVKSLIDTINVKGVSATYIEQVISTELAVMRTQYAEPDSSFLSDMYNNVIYSYLQLKESKIKLKAMAEAQAEIEEYVETIERLNEKLEDSERDLIICRQLTSR